MFAPTPTPSCTRNHRIDQLARMGCSFVLLAEKNKHPITPNWQDTPQSAERAKRHTGNLGVHAGALSNRIVWLDVDTNFLPFLDTFPRLKSSLISFRDNDPFRGKVAIHLTDRLPRSTSWKADPNQAKPDIELLSTGKQAAVIGIHPTGADYRLKGDTIVAMTFGELSAIWRHWTGCELPDPLAPKTTTRTEEANQTKQTESTNELARQVKHHWTCLSVFEHFGFTTDMTQESNGELRLRHNGGLLVNEAGDMWHQYSESVGGDAIAAWAWCTHHTTHLTAYEFVCVCHEMLAAAGCTIPTPEKPTFNWTALKQFFAQPNRYTPGRHGHYERDVMLALLSIMEKVNSIHAVKLSVREAGELSGMSHTTASKALRRLIRHNYIRRVDDSPSWFSHAVFDETDQHLVHQFDACAYSLTDAALSRIPEVSEVETVPKHQGPGAMPVSPSDSSPDTLDVKTLLSYADHDVFQFGAKVVGTDCRFGGKCALSIIVALESWNEQSAGELSEATGRSRSAISEKGKHMVDVGLLEMYKEGRTVYYYLVSNWRDRLETLIYALTTYCRTIKRTISHLKERLKRVGYAFSIAESGWLRKALYDLLTHWRNKLFNLNRQLSKLQEMRMSKVYGV